MSLNSPLSDVIPSPIRPIFLPPDPGMMSYQITLPSNGPLSVRPDSPTFAPSDARPQANRRNSHNQHSTSNPLSGSTGQLSQCPRTALQSLMCVRCVGASLGGESICVDMLLRMRMSSLFSVNFVRNGLRGSRISWSFRIVFLDCYVLFVFVFVRNGWRPTTTVSVLFVFIVGLGNSNIHVERLFVSLELVVF